VKAIHLLYVRSYPASLRELEEVLLVSIVVELYRRALRASVVETFLCIEIVGFLEELSEGTHAFVEILIVPAHLAKEVGHALSPELASVLLLNHASREGVKIAKGDFGVPF